MKQVSNITVRWVPETSGRVQSVQIQSRIKGADAWTEQGSDIDPAAGAFTFGSNAPDTDVEIRYRTKMVGGNIIDEWQSMDIHTAKVLIYYPDLINKPTKLGDVNQAEGTKLGGIAPGADVTGDNVSKDTAAVGGKPSAEIVREVVKIADIQRDIANVIATYGDTAAAGAAKTAAEAARDAARIAETNAKAAKDEAAQKATESATSATNANGFATTASGQATIAVQKATEAGTYASNASASESRAATKAGEASTSASNAATSSTNAGNSANIASSESKLAAGNAQVRGLTPNGSMAGGDIQWSVSPNMAYGNWYQGLGYRVAHAYATIQSSVFHRVDTTRKYKLHTNVTLHGPAGFARLYIGLACFDAGKNYLGNVYMPPDVVHWPAVPVGAVYNYSCDYTGVSGTAPVFGHLKTFITNTIYVQPLAFLNHPDYGVNTNCVIDIAGFYIEDVTDSMNAAGSANASAQSASVAATKAGEAGNSATAANNSKLAAEAANGSALGYANAASGSATTADQRASAASTSASQSAGFRDQASTHATNSYNASVASSNSAAASQRSAELAASYSGAGTNLEARVKSTEDAIVTANTAITNTRTELSTSINNVSGTVSQQAGTISTIAGKTNAYWSVDVTAGGRARISARADNYGSAVDIGADAVYLGNQRTLAVESGRVTVTGDLYLGGGRIVMDNGSVMKVQGTGFGTSNQFIEWFGPRQSSITNCSEANATFYLRKDGAAYFGGSLSAGVQKNSVQTTVTAPTANVTTGQFSSNGRARVVTVGYTLAASNPVSGACPVAQPVFVIIRLYRGVDANGTLLVEQRFNGSHYCERGSGPSEPGYMSDELGGSFTFTDNAGGLSTAYFVQIVQRSANASIQSQSLSVTSVEQ